MEIRLLGQLEAADGGRSLELGPPKQRAVLARLALDAGRVVRADQLLDDLWREDLPRSAPKMVQVYVSQLRKVLPEGRLRTEGGGYRLLLEDGERDLDRVDRLRAQAREALGRGDPAGAAAGLAEALRLWRGPALGDLDEPFAERERARLEDLRLVCLEERIDADIAAGAAAEVTGELEALIAAHPLRERPRAQLMLARYRVGRQAEALAAYRDFRRVLDEQLGLEPSAALRELEAAILRQDPELLRPSPAPEARRPSAPPAAAPVPAAAVEAPELPGRGEELEQLAEAFGCAAVGQRRTLFVTGAPGLGKTALVDAFVAGLDGAAVGRGQCIEGFGGAGEAYLPFIEALTDLAGREGAPELLGAVAPTWAVHVLGDPPASVAERARGATAQRLQREAIQALEALGGLAPVVVVLEDLHWADDATLELLSVLLRRSRPARLLVVGTLRPGPGAVRTLLDDARGQRTAGELALPPLDAGSIGEAIRARLDGAEVAPALAGVLHERCGGNPLFAGLVLDHWMEAHALAIEDGVVRPAGDVGELVTLVPPTVRASLQAQLGRLAAADRELLEAAAVAGSPFAVPELGATAGLGLDEVRLRLGALADRQQLIVRGDGEAFAFAHELQRDALLELVDAPRRAELHRRLGAHLEHEPDATANATRIALHLIEGGDARGAVRFLRLGAERALARNAYGIGIRHLRRALELVGTLPAGPGRERSELELLTALGQAVVGEAGWSAPEAESALLQARALAEGLGDNEPLLAVLHALATLYEVRGSFARAADTVRDSRRVAPDLPAGRALESHELLACNLFHQGAFTRALEHADKGVAAFERGDGDGAYADFPATLGDNAVVGCHDWAGLALWFLGFPDRALERARRALALAEEPGRRYSHAAACGQLAALHQCRGEPEAVVRWAEAALASATEYGYAFRVAAARALRGWARVRLGDGQAGVDDLVGGLAAARATGALMHEPLHLGMLADAYLCLDEPAEALQAAGEALALAARERAGFHAPELHRLRALALDRTGAGAEEVQAELDGGLALARRQRSRSLELRAALTQAELWARAGRATAGRAAVAAVFETFTEGHDTPDLRAAAVLLGRGSAAGSAA